MLTSRNNASREKDLIEFCAGSLGSNAVEVKGDRAATVDRVRCGRCGKGILREIEAIPSQRPAYNAEGSSITVCLTF